MIKELIHHARNSTLYRNSLYSMINTGIVTISGFLFWLLAVRIYSSTDIGLATTLSSSVLLVSGLSSLGLSSGLMRFLPRGSMEKLLSPTITLISAIGMVFSFLYVLCISSLTPSLSFIQSEPLFIFLFVLFVLVALLTDLLESTFFAVKKVIYILGQNSVANLLKFIFLLAFAGFGTFGIFSSIFLSMLVSVGIGVFLFYKNTGYTFKPTFAFQNIKPMLSYSFGSFASGQAAGIPAYVLPLFITNLTSPQITAYYFIAASVANFLFLIPKIVTQNLLVEGAHEDGKLTSHIRHASFLIFLFFIPAALIFLFLGDKILHVYGKVYSEEGFHLLQLFTISGFFVCINYIFGTVMAIQKQVKILVIVNFSTALTLILLSWTLLPSGLKGVGYATILTQALQCAFYVCLFIFKKWRKSTT